MLTSISSSSSASQSNPTSSSISPTSSSISPPPSSTNIFYTPMVDGVSLAPRGDTQCKEYAIDYNTKNPTDKYVGYGVRDDNHNNTCIFYKQSSITNSNKHDTSKAYYKIVSKCLDSTKYPDNFCLSTPPPAIEESVQPFMGYYTVYDDGWRSSPKILGEESCKTHIQTMNADPAFTDKYVGYSIRPMMGTSAPNSCMFYKPKQLAQSGKYDNSKDEFKIKTVCTNGKSANNWCA